MPRLFMACAIVCYQSSSHMRTGGICKLACKFRDKRLTAYIFIYLFICNRVLACPNSVLDLQEPYWHSACCGSTHLSMCDTLSILGIAASAGQIWALADVHSIFRVPKQYGDQDFNPEDGAIEQSGCAKSNPSVKIGLQVQERPFRVAHGALQLPFCSSVHMSTLLLCPAGPRGRSSCCGWRFPSTSSGCSASRPSYSSSRSAQR